MTAMNKMLLTLSVVLTLNGVAGAANLFSFEPPTYTAGLPLEGQDGWIRNGTAAGDVINTDSTHGLQSVFNPLGAFNFDHELREASTLDLNGFVSSQQTEAITRPSCVSVRKRRGRG